MSPTLSEDGTVLSWASTLEAEALKQAQRTASMPFVVKPLALMPDAHLGKGSTVGSVIATEGAIIPAAVGVDIGCVDRDTEYLSPTGWVPISEYASGPVMQYHPETGMASFVKPVRYIKRVQNEPFLHLRTKYGIDQMLTGDHRVLRWQVKGRARNEVMEVVSAAARLNSSRIRTRASKGVSVSKICRAKSWRWLPPSSRWYPTNSASSKSFLTGTRTCSSNSNSASMPFARSLANRLLPVPG